MTTAADEQPLAEEALTDRALFVQLTAPAVSARGAGLVLSCEHQPPLVQLTLGDPDVVAAPALTPAATFSQLLALTSENQTLHTTRGDSL